MTSANGSTIVLRYGNGTTGVDPASGEMWFKDDWTFIGGTGLFAGATGSGTEGGRFKDFSTVLGGTPVGDDGWKARLRTTQAASSRAKGDNAGPWAA